MITIQEARTSAEKRSQFLEELQRAYRPALVRFIKEHPLDDTSDASQDVIVQGFLYRANRAIDSVDLDDDGRGNHDPAAYCAAQGMYGARDAVRSLTHERHKVHKNTVLFPTAAEMAQWGFDKEEPDVADDVCFKRDMEEFLEWLTTPERDVCNLLALGYGRKPQGIVEIANILDTSIVRVKNILSRVRIKATILLKAGT